MKHLFYILLLTLPVTLLAQVKSQEFDLEEGEFLYSKPTMDKLKHIVDSMNLKFRSCEVADIYRSIPQTQGKFIFLRGDSATAAAEMLREQPDLQTFLAAFPTANVSEDLLVYKQWDRYDGKPTLEYSALTVGKQYGGNVTLDDDLSIDKPFEKRRWIWTFSEATKWSKETLKAYYLESEMKSVPLAADYARLVQYVDCMVDTTTTKILKDAQHGWYDDEGMDSLDQLSLPEKQALLQKLRSTRVVGGCSMDQSPRYHARDIAILAAETVNWEVFLRAHLDIMNDRFERMTDGSYAWKRRQTYLHELEVLDINTIDLIVGISLRIDNPHPNHYYGSVGRLGRAMAEAEETAELDAAILRMIQDPALDDFNRVILHNLYLSYIYQDEDPARRKASEEKFLEACKSLPPYLTKHVSIEN